MIVGALKRWNVVGVYFDEIGVALYLNDNHPSLSKPYLSYASPYFANSISSLCRSNIWYVINARRRIAFWFFHFQPVWSVLFPNYLIIQVNVRRGYFASYACWSPFSPQIKMTINCLTSESHFSFCPLILPSKQRNYEMKRVMSKSKEIITL